MSEEGAEQGKQLAERVQGKNTRKPDAQRRCESGAAGRQRKEESHLQVDRDGNAGDFLLRYGTCLLLQPLGRLPYGNWSAMLGSKEGNDTPRESLFPGKASDNVSYDHNGLGAVPCILE